MPILPIFVLAMIAAMPATAQEVRSDADIAAEQDLQLQPQLPPLNLSGPRSDQAATSSAGRAGQRQTREQVSRAAGIAPMERIAARVQNRVQSRIRNRIDRYYDPQANATAPFEVAVEQLRTTARRRR